MLIVAYQREREQVIKDVRHFKVVNWVVDDKVGEHIPTLFHTAGAQQTGDPDRVSVMGGTHKKHF